MSLGKQGKYTKANIKTLPDLTCRVLKKRYFFCKKERMPYSEKKFWKKN
jgi:hypothetical protein